MGCPACHNRTISQHYHECGGKRYIDEDLDLYCDKCNDKTFILNAKFRCNFHDYKEVNKMSLIDCMTSLSGLSDIPDNIIKKINKKLLS